MQITLHIDTGDKLSDNDKLVLMAIAGEVTTTTVTVNHKGPAPTTEEPKAASTPAAKKAAAKQPPVAKEEPETSEEEEAEEEPEYDIKAAISKATDLVSNGKGKEVKNLLTEMGAGRVSDLKGADIGKFITAANEI